MSTITQKIKTHKMGAVYSLPHFFILSKGNNSGKPLDVPCPNCFVCICNDELEKQRMYWLFYGLWQGLYFHPFLTGSVISFIRLDDLKQVVKTALEKINLKPQQFDENVTTMKLLDAHSKVILEQIKLVKAAKKAFMYKALK